MGSRFQSRLHHSTAFSGFFCQVLLPKKTFAFLTPWQPLRLSGSGQPGLQQTLHLFNLLSAAPLSNRFSGSQTGLEQLLAGAAL